MIPPLHSHTDSNCRKKLVSAPGFTFNSVKLVCDGLTFGNGWRTVKGGLKAGAAAEQDQFYLIDTSMFPMNPILGVVSASDLLDPPGGNISSVCFC